MSFQLGDIPSSKNNFSRRRLQAAADEVEERCLTRAVRADETDDFTLLHGELEISEGPDLTELFSQSFQLE